MLQKNPIQRSAGPIDILSSQPTEKQLLRAEINSWKKWLESLLRQNALLKVRLADFIRDESFDPVKLNNAEEFQINFIQQEQVINLLRRDLTQFEREIFTNDSACCGNITSCQTVITLRAEFEKLRVEFIKLSSRFYEFIHELY